MNDSNETQGFAYLETPRHETSPTKLDQILADRLSAFIKARTVKPYRIKRKKLS